MATFRHERTECQCVDREVNRRIFWLDPEHRGGSMSIWLRRKLPMQRASSAAMASSTKVSYPVSVTIASTASHLSAICS
jgi:hypothetical protein